MSAPTTADRTQLDKQISVLARLSGGLTLDDFRAERLRLAVAAERRVRQILLQTSFGFLPLLIAVLVVYLAYFDGHTVPVPDAGKVAMTVDAGRSTYRVVFVLLWALALGGLGAVASVFLQVLDLVPQVLLRTSDPFQVVGRIVLGCLLSMILSITLAFSQISQFFNTLKGGTNSAESLVLLMPFLAGYSIPLVLKILERAIRAVETSIGLDTDQARAARRGSRRQQ